MALGLVQDVYAIETLGANAMAKCLVGYAMGFFEEKVVKVMPATRILVLGVAFLIHDLVFYLGAGLNGEMLRSAFIHQTLPSCLYTLLLGAAIFYIPSNIKSRLT